jgi:prevent-host-death family protein
MASITIQEAQAQLRDLIHRLAPGEEVLITEHDLPIARLLPVTAAPLKKPRQLGTLKGTVLFMAPDFDEPLEDFKDYME